MGSSNMSKWRAMAGNYPRDLAGYGDDPPDPGWPGGARLALQVVLNYEEGGENCVLHGDAASEAFLSEIVGADARAGVRQSVSRTSPNAIPAMPSNTST